MCEAFKRLPDAYQGVIYVVIGIISILYALGIIEKGITLAIVLFALCMIGIGCIKVGLYQKTMHLLSQAKKQIKK